MKIVIAGAGIGGLTAAAALLKKGFNVTVFEQAQALKEIGAGVQLSPNATRVLYQLGVGDALEGLACEPLGKCVRLWNSGQSWRLFDLGVQSREAYGYPYFTLHRADLHQALADVVRAMKPDAIRLNHKVESFSQENGKVVVQAVSGETCEGDLLIGADGVHSRVRRALFGPDEPIFSGVMAWRGVIDAAKLPEHLRSPYGANWVGPGAHVIHYPLRDARLINFVGAIEKSGWQVESWSERGTLEECLADFEGWHEDVRTLISAIDIPYKWALMVREPMARWSQGHATLLGDACHPTLPFLAQGAGMAIEDGYLLARCLERYADDIPQALQRYEALRLDRTARVVRGSAANATRFHNPQLAHAEGAAAYVDREWSEERVKERYNWLFEYNVDAVEV
ncbi:Monooxygenase FAD-binding [Paraburkholderia piptadeniae]|uniref:Monooxygenase FAD-binding n=1 Tax=Paraburkholderia piptadeniae TaxID=1701573 RepID=A0A1N7SNQ8_9BURK|nr:FAD-dependent monooxygenase [Paraburkholderia piptadeniae]SIT48977.1 Monooxygenase FAD-binding [Paraburkholderia piptadeniae]